MNSIVILGANSFLGRAFVNNLNIEVLVKAIAREIPEDIDKSNNNYIPQPGEIIERDRCNF